MKKLLLLPLFLFAIPSVADAQPGGGMYSQQYPPMAFHNGLTFEGNLGLGYMVSRIDVTGGFGGDRSYSESVPAIGANVGLGGFINPNLAITGRIASVSYTYDANDNMGGTFTDSALFIGPSLQYWINPNLWVGGGIGFAIAHTSYTNDFGDQGDSTNDPTGIALDLRIGYTFYKSMRNSLNISAEYTPGFYGEEDRGAFGRESWQLNGFAVLFGYQYL